MKNNSLSILLITKNADEMLNKVLSSIKEIASEIVIADNNSSDDTIKIASKYNAKIIQTDENNLGKQRLLALKYVTSDWVLALDADEIVSRELKEEIKNILMEKHVKYDGFFIKYQNHFCGKVVQYGGENYKVLRLFKKNRASIKPSLLHEKFLIDGKIGLLNHKINHYSYRSIFQTYLKFTKYALRGAKEKKNSGEELNFKKLTLYPLHMFWARFIEDKGYKDGVFRIPLDLGFAYMEFATYFFMIFVKKRK